MRAGRVLFVTHGTVEEKQPHFRRVAAGGTPQPDLERRHALTGRYRVATRVAYPGRNSAPLLEVGTVDSGIAHSHGYVEYMCRLYDKQ